MGGSAAQDVLDRDPPAEVFIPGEEDLAHAALAEQFLQGGGDEDDGADLQLNVGDPSQAAGAVVWVQARSTDQSGHYLQFQFQRPNSSLFIYGVTQRGGWDQATATDVTWSSNPGSTSPQYFVSNSTNSLAIVDLNQLFPNDSGTAKDYFIATVQGTLTQQQIQTLFTSVGSYIGL